MEVKLEQEEMLVPEVQVVEQGEMVVMVGVEPVVQMGEMAHMGQRV